MVFHLNIEPHELQWKIINDPHRFIAIEAGRKFGKSVSIFLAQIYCASKKPGSMHWYIGPTFKQTKEIIWERAKGILGGLCKKVSESDHSIMLPNHAFWQVKGADDPQSLRGPGADSIALDECRDIRSAFLWDEVLRPELAPKLGRAWFASSKARNWYSKLLSKQDYDKDWKTYRFQTIDNPLFSKEEWDMIVKNTPQHILEKEYLNKDVAYEGLVYSSFKEKRDIIPSFPIPEHWPIFVGVDWGIADPTAFIFYAINPDDRMIYGWCEHYKGNAYVELHSKIVLDILKNRKAIFVADPTMWRRERGDLGCIANDFMKASGRKINLIPGQAKPKSRARGIVMSLFDAGQLKFFTNMTNTIREFSEHQYISHPEGSEKNTGEKTVDSNDHTVNATEYVMTYIHDVYSKKLPFIATSETLLKRKLEQEEMVRIARENAKKPFRNMLDGREKHRFDWREYYG